MALKASMLLCLAAAVTGTGVYAEDATAGDAHQAATVYAPGDLGEIRHFMTVRIDGVNFHRQGDVAGLYGRITYAANQVCGPRALTGSYSKSPGYARCYTEAVSNAVAHVNRPELTNYHQERLARSARLASN
jgi:UrcA family protein